MKKLLSAILAIAMVVSLCATAFVASTGAAGEDLATTAVTSNKKTIVEKFEEAQKNLWFYGPYWSVRATTYAATVGLLNFTSGEHKGEPDYLGASKEDHYYAGAGAARDSIETFIGLINMIADDGFPESYTHDANGFLTNFPEYEFLNGNPIEKEEAEWSVRWPDDLTGADFLAACKEFNTLCHWKDVIDLGDAAIAAKLWGCSSWAEACRSDRSKKRRCLLKKGTAPFVFGCYSFATKTTAAQPGPTWVPITAPSRATRPPVRCRFSCI